MKINALFTYDYGKERMDKLRQLGYNIIFIDERTIEYSELLKDIEVLVCYNPFNTLDIKKLKELKYIQLSSIGIDQVPLDVVKEKQISLCNNKGGYSIPIGEWIVLKILEMLKNSKKAYENQLNHIWKMDMSLLELCDKTVGFIGTGSLAVEGAKRLSGFDVNILGVNTDGRNVQYFHKCFDIEHMKHMVKQCDIIVLTAPYTKETHHLINEEVINEMKDGVFLVNVARGAIVDEEAIIKALKTKKIAMAALDVFETEPLDKNSELWSLENAIINSHNSWVSDNKDHRRFELIYENLKRYKNKDNLLNKVDLNRGY